MTAVIGVGQFIAWQGGCVFLGRHDNEIPMHTHQAMQLAVGRSANARARTSEHLPWTAYSAMVVASRQPHVIDVTDSDYGAVVFIEPETREGRMIRERHLGANGIADVCDESLFPATTRLFDAWLEQRGRAAIAEAGRRVVQVLAGGIEPSVVTDDRILNAIEYVSAHLDDTPTLDAVASHACLSPSRFRHLFVEQTGMGLRPYLLWRRFLRVWELLALGHSVSAAAHSAGFADAAHLTRTSQRYFGFAPSALRFTSAPPPARPRHTEAGSAQPDRGTW